MGAADEIGTRQLAIRRLATPAAPADMQCTIDYTAWLECVLVSVQLQSGAKDRHLQLILVDMGNLASTSYRCLHLPDVRCHIVEECTSASLCKWSSSK